LFGELATGLAALALAAAYYAAADALPKSLLSDAVGDDGVPKALALALAAAGAAQAVRALLSRRPAEKTAVDMKAHRAALGLLLIVAAYVAVMPYLGYLPATALLIFAAATYAGQPSSLRLAAVSLGGGLVLWGSFAKLLGVAMPTGLWARLLG
jgi:hypothetical protein